MSKMRNICVPVNIMAMRRLDLNACIEGDLIEILINDDDFYTLWKIKVFDIINHKIGVLIDDYEDESIVNFNDLLVVNDIIEQIIKNYNYDILNKLLDQTKNAIKYKTGLFFFF